MSGQKITLDRNSLLLDGKRILLVGGEMHYFRIPREHWKERLHQIKQAGCNLITTYVPWNWHEPVQGQVNWEGDRDLAHFLELAKQEGMYVIIKPGPYICAEWDFGGFPDWLMQKDLPLRLPDKRYLSFVEKWYKDVAEVIRPFQVTRGGNIVLIQIENEYDHLIRMSDLVENEQVARDYLLTLLRFVREAGIDVPGFTNEGQCILGTEIINSHTYYPNIPWLWEWEFSNFDDAIEKTLKHQPDKPLMILELEAGWFDDNNFPHYEVGVDLTDAIVKSTYAYGASVFNYYMVTGGTSFGYWPARGDFKGTGICNTFDFGGSPVREWGELHPKYHSLRHLGWFTQDFPDLLGEGTAEINGSSFVQGGETVSRLTSDKAELSADFSHAYANLKTMLRRSKDLSAVFVRNLESDLKKVKLSWNSEIEKKNIVFPSQGLNLPAFSSFLLPVDCKLTDVFSIRYATAELIARRKAGGKEYVILKGHEEVQGEMVIAGDARISILAGSVNESNTTDGIMLRYSHNEPVLFESGDLRVLIIPVQMAGKLWLEEDRILISDLYYFEDRKGSEWKFRVKSSDSAQKTYIWPAGSVSEAFLDGKKLSVSKDHKLDCNIVELSQSEKASTALEWIGDWKFKSDTAEKDPEFDDGSWASISAKDSLEKAGYFRHGWYWYRTSFDLPEGAKDVNLELGHNDIDWCTVYLNGKLLTITNGKDPKVTTNEPVNIGLSGAAVKGKNVLAVCYENAFHTKAHPNEGPIQKHSGLYKPTKVTWQGGEYSVKEWKLQDGLAGVNADYASESFDDSAWAPAPASKKIVTSPDAGNIVWLRRKVKFTRDKNWEAPLYLEFSQAKARCLVYVNGFHLARYDDRGPQKKYYIPDSLLKEENIFTLVLEGPGYHHVLSDRFEPARLTEPAFGTYFQAKKISLDLK